jgi:hypothetical protein
VPQEAAEDSDALTKLEERLKVCSHEAPPGAFFVGGRCCGRVAPSTKNVMALVFVTSSLSFTERAT